MKMDDFFSSKYLKSEDLKGREVTVRIADVQTVKMQDGQKKAALYFRGKEKALLLNKINANKIASAYGDDMDNWVEREILLYPDTTNYNGSMVPCLRVRVPAASPASGDENPVDW